MRIGEGWGDTLSFIDWYDANREHLSAGREEARWETRRQVLTGVLTKVLIVSLACEPSPPLLPLAFGPGPEADTRPPRIRSGSLPRVQVFDLAAGAGTASQQQHKSRTAVIR